MSATLHLSARSLSEYDPSQRLLMERRWLRENDSYLFPQFESACAKHVKSENDSENRVPNPGQIEDPVIVPTPTAPTIKKRKRNAVNVSKKRARIKTNTKTAIGQTICINPEEKPKKKGVSHYRVKWSDHDVDLLWNAIRTTGNKWSLIKSRLFPKRTNDQVKDKGKRLLRRLGWQTGITKSHSVEACASAKRLAEQFLEQNRTASSAV